MLVCDFFAIHHTIHLTPALSAAGGEIDPPIGQHSVPLVTGADRQYTYNGFNQQTGMSNSVAKAKYSYAPSGLRSSKTSDLIICM